MPGGVAATCRGEEEALYHIPGLASVGMDRHLLADICRTLTSPMLFDACAIDMQRPGSRPITDK